MSNSLQLKSITYSSGQIAFPEYQDLLSQAELIAGHVSNMTVDEDNIKEVKKTLAGLNRAVRDLNDRRIQIKKDMMKPYDEFHSQIKNIESIIKEADNTVRSQVRELEERERQEKKELIEEEWEKRVHRISYKDLLNFENFLTPQHLNKSTSMNKVLEDMGQFLKQVDTDYEVLLGMNDELAVSIYFETYDLGESISRANKHRAEIERIQKVSKEKEDDFEFIDDEVEESLVAVLTIREGADKAIDLLEKHGVEFELRWE